MKKVFFTAAFVAITGVALAKNHEENKKEIDKESTSQKVDCAAYAAANATADEQASGTCYTTTQYNWSYNSYLKKCNRSLSLESN